MMFKVKVTDDQDKEELATVMQSTGPLLTQKNDDVVVERNVTEEGGDDEDDEDDENEETEPGSASMDAQLKELMRDNTLVTLGKTRLGYTVVVVPCPEHPADITDTKGIFVMNISLLATQSGEELDDYIKNLHNQKGCTGHPDCEISLLEAIEEEEKPEKIFCPETGGKTHTIDVDMPCATHQHNRPIGNLIKAMILLHNALKKGGRKLKPAEMDIPAIQTYLCEGKAILPLSLLAALTLDTMSRGSHEYSED